MLLIIILNFSAVVIPTLYFLTFDFAAQALGMAVENLFVSSQKTRQKVWERTARPRL